MVISWDKLVTRLKQHGFTRTLDIMNIELKAARNKHKYKTIFHFAHPCISGRAARREAGTRQQKFGHNPQSLVDVFPRAFHHVEEAV